MKIICSFCNQAIRQDETDDHRTSHGVCRGCYEKIMTDFGFNTTKFLEMFDAPVFLVNANADVLAANYSALALSRSKASDLNKPTPCGEVLGCINASLPEGCGKTSFCPDCNFRNTIDRTFTTGHPTDRLPAILEKKTGEQVELIHFRISTRKDGDVVLLRLEIAQ